MKKILLLLGMMIGVPFCMNAQNEMYFFSSPQKEEKTVPQKKETPKNKQESNTNPGKPTRFYVPSGSTVVINETDYDNYLIDEYNRRGQVMQNNGEEYEYIAPTRGGEWINNGYEGSASDYRDAERIIQSRDRRYSISVNSPYYFDIVYGLNSWDWNIYVDNWDAYIFPRFSNSAWSSWKFGPRSGFGFSFGWNSWDPWYPPYYASGWNSWGHYPGSWGGWYDPWYRPYYNSYWGWNDYYYPYYGRSSRRGHYDNRRQDWGYNSNRYNNNRNTSTRVQNNRRSYDTSNRMNVNRTPAWNNNRSNVTRNNSVRPSTRPAPNNNNRGNTGYRSTDPLRSGSTTRYVINEDGTSRVVNDRSTTRVNTNNRGSSVRTNSTYTRPSSTRSNVTRSVDRRRSVESNYNNSSRSTQTRTPSFERSTPRSSSSSSFNQGGSSRSNSSGGGGRSVNRRR